MTNRVITRRYFFLGALALAGKAQNRTGPYRPDYSAWQSVGSGSWTDEDGVVSGRFDKNRPGAGYLLTREEVKDFRLNLLFWISTGGSSAIYVREPRRKWGNSGDDRPGCGENCGYELKIDYHDSGNPTGTISNVQKARKISGAEEQWNEMEIICRGSEIRMSIAGQNVNRFNRLRAQAGVIGFKIPDTAPDGFVVRFRDVVISPAP